jgi:hypothetical protein
VPHGNAAGRLLERELPDVRDDQRELLLVIRAERRLPRALDEDDPELAGW